MRMIGWLILLLAAAVLLVPFVFSRLASLGRCVSVYSTGGGMEKTQAPDGRIRVACYNIAHGRGLAVSNWDGGSRAERIARLDEIADLLRRIDADVVVLNEVDFDASWSHSVNQAQYLADKAGYPYRAEQRNLDFQILFWTWRFGNAVLSKYPITDARVVDLPGYSSWETVLAGKKRAIRCEISLGGRSVRVVGAHLSSRSEALRVSSANALADIAAGSTLPTIVAGDLNSTPPGFPESASDPDGNNAMETLDDASCFQRSPLSRPVAADELTFHCVEPRCVIDWVLIPLDWHFLQYSVELSQLSDHRPVHADIAPTSTAATSEVAK